MSGCLPLAKLTYCTMIGRKSRERIDEGVTKSAWAKE
jgi:hypothetical protein